MSKERQLGFTNAPHLSLEEVQKLRDEMCTNFEESALSILARRGLTPNQWTHLMAEVHEIEDDD